MSTINLEPPTVRFARRSTRGFLLGFSALRCAVVFVAALVDEYLEFCKAEGKSPDVPFKGNFNVRVPQDLHQRAALYAEEHEVKLNAVVQDALREYLTHAE